MAKKQRINELAEMRQSTAATGIPQLYKAIFDNAADGIIVADIDSMKFHTGNIMICEMLGYSLEEIKNMGVMDIHPEEDLPYVMEQFKRLSRNDILLAKDIPVKRKDGSIFYVDIKSFLITLTGKTYIAGIFRDTTERKRAEEELRISEDKYRLLFENATDAIFIAQDEKIYFPNPQLSILTGYSFEELTEKSFRHFIHPEDSDMVAERHRNRLQGKTVPSSYSFRVIRKTGEIIWVEVNSVIITWDNRPATLAFLRDITERKNAEENLKEKERELEIKAKNLEEVNTALKVLLKKRDEDRTELEEKVLLNMKELVLPYLDKIKMSGLDTTQNTYANIMESHLKDIVSSFSYRLSSAYLNLTPSEIKVANLVKQGRTNKEIAELLNFSARTAAFHRERIREKLGIKNQKTNLKSYLLSMN